jgi:hypothetical protein
MFFRALIAMVTADAFDRHMREEQYRGWVAAEEARAAAAAGQHRPLFAPPASDIACGACASRASGLITRRFSVSRYCLSSVKGVSLVAAFQRTHGMGAGAPTATVFVGGASGCDGAGVVV